MNLRDRALRQHADDSIKWQIVTGFKGQTRHVFDDHLEVVVKDDVLARDKPFVILEMSREVARYALLETAKADVLLRLIKLNKTFHRAK